MDSQIKAKPVYIRNVRCTHCGMITRYNHLDPNSKRGPVVDPTLSPKEKRKAYRRRYLDKKGCLLDSIDIVS